MENQNKYSQIIDSLGGTFAVASIFEIKPPSVSEWRKKGIPKARLMYLRLARPDVLRNFPDVEGVGR